MPITLPKTVKGKSVVTQFIGANFLVDPVLSNKTQTLMDKAPLQEFPRPPTAITLECTLSDRTGSGLI